MKKSPSSEVFEDIVYTWMKSHEIPVNKKFIESYLNAHPDYPSLTALTDLLDLGGMRYYAIESSREFIGNFRYPILAHIKDENSAYMHLIKTPDGWNGPGDLLNNWTGIVIFPNGHPSWKYDQNDKQSRIRKGLRTSYILLGLTLSVILGWLITRHTGNGYPVWWTLSIIGTGISLATLSTELGMKIKLVQEMCNSVSNRGCDAVLKSRYAEGFLGISVSDMAVSYFLTQLLLLAISVRYTWIFPALPALAIPLIVVAGASLYLQKFKLKRWCALCLGIVGVLLLQGVTALIMRPVLEDAWLPVLLFLACQALICAIWVPLKRAVSQINEQFRKGQDLDKWKRNEDIFIAQWLNTPQVPFSLWKNDIQYGNPSAAIRITVACQPFCGPCKDAHEALDKLYHIYKNQANFCIRFMCDPENQEDKRTRAVAAILRQAAANPDTETVAEMLADWYIWMDLDKWQQKWKTTSQTDVTGLIRRHKDWMEVAGVKGTPTIFINGRALPKKYLASDLLYLIPQLAASGLPLEDNTEVKIQQYGAS